METLLSSFRIGVVQLFGIIIPGTLVIILLGLGVIFPLFFLTYQIFSWLSFSLPDFLEFSTKLYKVYHENQWFFIIIFIIISYIIGYSLRLSTADELDQRSGRQVLKNMRNHVKDLLGKAYPEDQIKTFFFPKKIDTKRSPFLELLEINPSNGIYEYEIRRVENAIFKKRKKTFSNISEHLSKDDTSNQGKESEHLDLIMDFVENPEKDLSELFENIKFMSSIAKSDAQSMQFSEEALLALQEIRQWPYTGQANDKLPYFKYYDYAIARELEFADNITWGADGEVGKKRTKSLINHWKVKIKAASKEKPSLATLIESQEAHVRMTFGTWMAFKISIIPIAIATVLCIGYIILFFSGDPFHFSKAAFDPVPVILFINGIFLFLIWQADKRIKHRFHYQRVKELSHIMMCYYEIKDGNLEAVN